MNLGLIVPSFSDPTSDWHVPLYASFLHRLSRKIDVRVFTPGRNQRPYSIFKAKVYPVAADFRRTSQALEQAVREQHRQQPFDVIHAIGADEVGYHANYLGRQLDCPTIVTVAHDELLEPTNISAEALAGATQIVASCQLTGEHVRNLLIERQLGGIDRILIVPLGVDTKLFDAAPEGSERLRTFIYVGGLEPIKRVDLLLNLVAKMPGTTLDIVGKGSEEKRLKAQARALNLQLRVKFHRDVAHNQLPHLYQQAEFFLTTSHYEAFGLHAIQALACGTSPMGTAVGVLPEVGQTVPVDEIDKLPELIVGRKRGNTDLLRARKSWRAQNQFSAEHMIGGYLDVYRRLVGDKVSPT